MVRAAEQIGTNSLSLMRTAKSHNNRQKHTFLQIIIHWNFFSYLITKSAKRNIFLVSKKILKNACFVFINNSVSFKSKFFALLHLYTKKKLNDKATEHQLHFFINLHPEGYFKKSSNGDKG